MVDDGDTEIEPPAVGVTVPTPLSIDALVAFDVVHESVLELPDVMLPGLADNVLDGAAGAAALTTWVRFPAASYV